MGKKSSKTPDVVGAAREEGQISRATARDATWADRPDQFNPMGSITWDTQVVDAQGNPVNMGGGGLMGGPGSPGSPGGYGGYGTDRSAELPDGYTTKWTQNQTLSDGAQELYDNQLNMMRGRSNLAASMNDRVAEDMSTRADFDQFGDVIAFNPTDTGLMGYDPTQARMAAEDAAYSKATNRMDPYYEQQMQQTEIDLRGKGLRPGDEAYDRAMSGFNTGRNDAYEQARLGASAEGRTEADFGFNQLINRSNTIYGQELQTNQTANAQRQQQIDEYLGKRGFSLAEQERLGQGQTVGDLAQNFSGGAQ